MSASALTNNQRGGVAKRVPKERSVQDSRLPEPELQRT